MGYYGRGGEKGGGLGVTVPSYKPSCRARPARSDANVIWQGVVYTAFHFNQMIVNSRKEKELPRRPLSPFPPSAGSRRRET